MITKILVGYDGSDCSKRALNLGLELAEKYRTSVTVINVVELPIYSNPQDPFAVSADSASINSDIRRTHQKELTKIVQEVASQYPNVHISMELRDGNPPTQIVSVAEEGGFDLVVVGHSGTGRLRELFLGGTSERVAHLAKCPVLIVK